MNPNVFHASCKSHVLDIHKWSSRSGSKKVQNKTDLTFIHENKLDHGSRDIYALENFFMQEDNGDPEYDPPNEECEILQLF